MVEAELAAVLDGSRVMSHESGHESCQHRRRSGQGDATRLRALLDERRRIARRTRVLDPVGSDLGLSAPTDAARLWTEIAPVDDRNPDEIE